METFPTKENNPSIMFSGPGSPGNSFGNFFFFSRRTSKFSEMFNIYVAAFPGITESSHLSGLNTFINENHEIGILDKNDPPASIMKLFYPVLGDTATTQKGNLIDPLKFVGIFNGGVTHSLDGALPNGANGFMDTTFVDSAELTSRDDMSFFTIYKDNANEAHQDGARNVGRSIIQPRNGDVFACNTNSAGVDSVASTDARGPKGWFRTASNAVDVNDKGIITSSTTVSNAFSGRSYYFMARNAGAPQTFGSKGWLGGGAIDKGLNASDQGDFFTSIDTFQQTMGRKTW